MIGTLLSKASHSDELVARINHADIICKFFNPMWIYDKFNWNASLFPLINGIGDYLTRVVSSVPIGLNATLSAQFDDCCEGFIRKIPSSVTLGLLYYDH